MTLPAQQLFSALQDIVAILQMAPAGRHAWPLSHRPTGSVGFALLHSTPDEFGEPTAPQQSAVVLQISPVGRQPLGGWHMRRPERCGAQARLQHSPPHDGMPLPPSASPPQATPATVHPGTPGGLGSPQVPTVAPAALSQIPPQHSLCAAQTSPFCVQNDPVEQTPPLQSLEQHSSLAAQALPVVRQTGFSGAHTPALQVPLQHCAELVHAWLSEVHCAPLQVPALQRRVQQSCGLAHELPPGRQVPPPAPPAPPVAPVPPVPPVLASVNPPAPPDPPAPPVDIPSTLELPHAAVQRIALRAAMAVPVSRFLTLCSLEMDPPAGIQIASAILANGSSLKKKQRQPYCGSSSPDLDRPFGQVPCRDTMRRTRRRCG